MKVFKTKVNGTWTEYTLKNDYGIQVSFLNFGGIITKIIAHDKNGIFENIVLGYKNYQDYERNPSYLGAIVGRVAGRIEHATFSLSGQNYKLDKNDGKNHLHGGASGLHQVVWKVETFELSDRVGAKLFYYSPHGEGGYPGDVEITVTYSLMNNNKFVIDYGATTNQTTILSMTNHSYFNLTGDLTNTIEDHYIQVDADQVIELDQEFNTTGKLLSVENTPFDLRRGEYFYIGMTATHEQNKIVKNGFDHYFLFNRQSKPQVTVTEPISGRVLTLETNHSGMVLYTSNILDESLILRERLSERYLGFCLETHEHAASLKNDQIPSVIIYENNPYHKQTVFSFETILK